MLKILKYVNKRQWFYIALSVAFIVAQVWLDLKLPDYMSAITTLVQTEGSEMSEILAQGAYMLLCALGSGVCSVIVGYFAARVAAGLARTPASSTAPPTTSPRSKTWSPWAFRPS